MSESPYSCFCKARPFTIREFLCSCVAMFQQAALRVFGRKVSGHAPLRSFTACFLAPSWHSARDCSGQDTATSSTTPHLDSLKGLQHSGAALWRALTTASFPGRGVGVTSGFQQHHLIHCMSSLHTWEVLRAKTSRSESGREQGSVLTQFVGKNDEPKQVTVATKGQICVLICLTTLYQILSTLYLTSCASR